MSQTVLQLDNVEFRRNRRVIITDVNLTINAGERWVLFGPNGIGKCAVPHTSLTPQKLAWMMRPAVSSMW